MWHHKCCSTPTSCCCIRVFDRHHDAYPNKCCTPRLSCIGKCTIFDTIQVHKRSCWDRCSDKRSCCHCNCPKIKIRNMHSESSVEECGDSRTSSIKLQQCTEKANVEKEKETKDKKDEVSKKEDKTCGEDIQTKCKENEVSEPDSSIDRICKPATDEDINNAPCNTAADTAKTDDVKLLQCDPTITKSPLLASTNSTKKRCKNKIKISKVKSSKCNPANSFSDLTCSITTNTCDQCFSSFTCPECCQIICYFPFELEENRCFKCPECCRLIKYFDDSFCTDTNTYRTSTNIDTKKKYCERSSINNDQELKKRKIYREFLELCRNNCYHPQIMENLLLSSRNMCRPKEDGSQNLFNSTPDRIPFTNQLPPMTNYFMYGNRLDDWFTHYLMRYLSRVDSEEEYRGLTWLEEVRRVIEAKHMKEYYAKQRPQCLNTKYTVDNLSRLYNSMVEPTLSEMCFYY